jgi:hypothetical protein
MYDISLEDDGVYQSELINYGIITFDNLPISMLTILQIITLEGWSSIMYNVRLVL